MAVADMAEPISLVACNRPVVARMAGCTAGEVEEHCTAEFAPAHKKARRKRSRQGRHHRSLSGIVHKVLT